MKIIKPSGDSISPASHGSVIVLVHEIDVTQPSWISDEELKSALRQLDAFKHNDSDFNVSDNNKLRAVFRWLQSMEQAETTYNELIALGVDPQYARGVLPYDALL